MFKTINNLLYKVKSMSIKSIFYLVILYLTSIIGFGKFLIIAYFQSPENFGKFVLLIGVMTFTGTLISFGEIEQTIKKYPTYWITKQYNLINKSMSREL